MTTPRFKIPSFEELLKKVRQPKVTVEDLTKEPPPPSPFGNLPPGWSVKGDSLLSPRGLTFRDLKIEDGKIVDFQPFRGDRPVRFSPLKPPTESFPASDVTTAPMTPFQEPVGELRTLEAEESILRRRFTEEAITRMSGEEKVKEATDVLRLEQKFSKEQKEIPLSRVPFTPTPAEQAVTPSPEPRQGNIGFILDILTGRETPTNPEGLDPVAYAKQFPASEAAITIIPLVATLGVAVYQGLPSLIALTRGIPDKVLQTALNTGLDRWIARRSRGIPPQSFKKAQNTLFNLIAKDREWLQQRATENMLRRMGRTKNETQAAKQAVDDTIRDVEQRIAGLVPRFTPGGSAIPGQTQPLAGIMAAGRAELGVPTVQSVVAKIVANQPLNAAERQLYATQAQEVEAALQAQVAPVAEPTPTVVTPVTEGGWVIDIETGKPRTTEFKAISHLASGEANLLQTPEGEIIERIATGKQKGWWKILSGTTEYVGKTPERALEIAKERGAIIPKGKALVPEVTPTEGVAPLSEALIAEGESIATKAEAIQPDNEAVKGFRIAVDEAKTATTPEAQRQALIKMESLEDEVREVAGVTPEPVVGGEVTTVIPKVPTVEPESLSPEVVQDITNRAFGKIKRMKGRGGRTPLTLEEVEAIRLFIKKNGALDHRFAGKAYVGWTGETEIILGVFTDSEFVKGNASEVVGGQYLIYNIKNNSFGSHSTNPAMDKRRVSLRTGETTSGLLTEEEFGSRVKDWVEGKIPFPSGRTPLPELQVAKPPEEPVVPAQPPVTPEVPAEPSPKAPKRAIRPVKKEVAPKAEVKAKPPTPKAVVTEPQKATKKVQATQKSKTPESVAPEEAKVAHIELASPDGPKPPKPPAAKKDSGDIFKEIAEKGFDERPDQTLLRLHEATVNNEVRRTGLTIKAGGEKLKEQDIGVWRRDHLIPKPKDIEKLDELYVALHNPSGVASGAVKIPEGFEGVYEELRALADWETAATLDFDPKAATLDDWFFRGWKPPADMFAREGGRLAVKPKALRTPRVDATYQEMRDLGFEPLFWNPYEQWGYRHNLGVKYREQMELVNHLKGLGEELIRPHDGGPIPTGWRVPEVGPAFEGKPFAIKDPDTGELGVMFTRRWITEGKIANALENIYGKRPDLGKFVVRGRVIDPLAIIDVLTFFPKRAKLFGSYFQQVDFLTRAGGGGWAKAVDDLAAGRPIEAVKSVAKYPQVAFEVVRANFSPTKRLKLSQQLDSTETIVQGRPGINLKGISDAGLSTRDVTIFPADMDKLVREVANETGILAKGKRVAGAVGDLESAMRRGLFEGVYPAAIITDIQNNIAPMVARQHPTLNDAQINSIIARIANIKYSTIPPAQSVFQNRALRETLRRLFFSVGESEGLLRQATNAFHGPNKRFWAKHWMGVYLFLITTASIIHYASTGEPLPAERFTPIAKDKWGPLPFGYNTEFAAPTLPFKGRGGAELTLDLAGQMDTAFRILDPVNFITSRESVPVRAAANQISGTDFYGAPIDDVGPGGIISRASQLLHDLFAPIGLGGITGEAAREFIPGGEQIIPRAEDRLGYGGLLLQATGVNVRAETTINLLNRIAKESGLVKADGTPVQNWADLEPFQKNELTRNEDLETELGLRSEAAIERQQLGSLGFSTLDNLDKERIVRGEALMAELYSEVEGLSGTELASKYSEFREAATDLKREISIRKAQASEDFQLFKDTGKIEKDPNKRALTEYYNTYELAKKQSGVMDWDKQATLEAILRRKWIDAQEAYVDRNLGLTEWGPLFDVYEESRRGISDSGYWDVEPEEKEQFLADNPNVESSLLLWGYRTTPTTIEAAIQLEADANKYGIPLDSIQAFSKTESGKERLPSNRDLWEHYFFYYDLPGVSYLNMSEAQVEAGKLPAEYRKEWETYNKLKTDKARGFYRKAHRKAAYSQWREDFRRANPEFDKWLVDEEYNKPLPKKTFPRPSARPITLRSRGGFGGISVARPRRTRVSFPKFKAPRVSRSIRAPRVPGF